MKRTFIKVFSGMVLLVIFSKALGFVRESMIAARYGAGLISDVYVFEDGLINAIYTIFAGVIATTYIPKATSLDSQERNRFTNNYLTFLFSIILFISVIFIAFTPVVLRILVPGFYSTYDSEVLARIKTITRINMISLALVFFENYFIVLLQSHNYFIFSSVQGIILNVSLILYLSFLYRFEVEGIIITKLIAHTVNVGILLFFTFKKSLLKLKLHIDLKSEHLTDVLRLALPVFFVNLISQLNYIIDRSMASSLDSGSMALLSYANTIASMLYSVIGVTICQIAYTDISEKQNNRDLMNTTFETYLMKLLTVIIPCCIVLIVNSKEVASIIFGRGKMTSSDIEIMSKILVFYIPSNFAMCVRDMHNRLLYIYKKTTLPSLINLGGLVINIVLNITLTKLIGVYGLALATSISSMVSLIVTLIICRKYKSIDLKKMGGVIVKLAICTCLTVTINAFIHFESVMGKIILVGISLSLCMLIFNGKILLNILRGKR